MAINDGKKMVRWIFDQNTIKVSDDSIQADKEKKFAFQLTRFKDNATHEESLKIDCFLDGADNGSITTDICSLENDLKEFRRYGVALSTIDFRDIRKVIEDNYLQLDCTAISLESDSRFSDLLEIVKEYVQQADYLITESFAYVRVSDFNGIAEDCGYYPYETRTLRLKLADMGYLRKQGNRFAGLVRLRDKPERVISFYRDKLGVPYTPKKRKDVDGNG